MTRIMLAICMIVLPVTAMGDNRTKFTEAEVRQDAEKFINIVFGKKPPTLADRFKFGGGYETLEVDERALLYELCKRKFNIANPEESKECFEDIITPRLEKPARFESLYYNLIRNKLGISASQLKLSSIRWAEGVPGKYSGIFLITFDIDDSKWHSYFPPQLLLEHVPFRDDVADSGTIRIHSVLIPISKYLGMPE